MKHTGRISALLMVLIVALALTASPALSEESGCYDWNWWGRFTEANGFMPMDVWKCLLPIEYQGHVYQVFQTFELTYDGMERFCEMLGGHLACITSEDEDRFLYDEYLSALETEVCYFGLYLDDTDGAWHWIDGEPADYLAWADGEPNGFEDGERYGCYYPAAYENGEWNDAIFDRGSVFMCEWDSPKDRVVTAYRPFKPMKIDGHCYVTLYAPHLTWEEMRTVCETYGGYLACITSPEEDATLAKYAAACGELNVSFGLYCDPGDEWHWVSREPLDYTNWADGEPNNGWDAEPYGGYYEAYPDGGWNDHDGLFLCFICEWDYEEMFKLFYDNAEFVSIQS